jgi:hypothetical protein
VHFSPAVIKVLGSRRMRGVEHEEMRNADKSLVGKPE